MSLWTIIPVKPLKRAKSRLADVLSPEQRYAFAESMLRQVLSVVAKTPQVTGTLVISRDTKALAIARDMGAKTVQEGEASDLNPALLRATEVVRMWRAQAILVLPADLPFITVDDVTEVINLSHEAPCVVAVPDRYNDGTNALLVRPPGLIQYAYGIGSFERHIDMATELGATIRVHQSQTLQLDIDVPEDLEVYNRQVERQNYEMLTTFLPDKSN
jgi:2-phospho-L-lactate guanylyltransferase